MDIQSDFRDLFALLNDHHVDYMIVGGYAAFHGAPRYTGDIDIFVRPDIQNAQSILKALEDFGFGGLGLTQADFENPDMIVQLGVPPVRVDIITSLTGVSWEDAGAERVSGLYGDVPASYIGRGALLKNKRAIGRKKDLADIESLGEE